MNIDRYLSTYESYRNTVYGLKRVIEKLREEKARQGQPEEFEELESRYLKKKSILDYATRRLQREISRIKDPKLSTYLVCKYLCGMKNDEIAESFNYCERQIYRIASRAKKRLENAIRINTPRPRRGRHRMKYRFSSKITDASLRKYRRKKYRR